MPAPGAFQLNVETQGRLTDARRSSATSSSSPAPTGAWSRVSDIARVELGAAGLRRQRLSRRASRPSPLGIFQRPGSNALADRRRESRRTMDELPKDFPAGPRLPTSSTTRPSSSQQSVDAVIKTMFEAMVLVVHRR